MDRSGLDSTIDQVAETLRPLGLVLDSEWPDLATIQAKLAGPGLNARFLALPMYPTFAGLIRSKDRLGHPAHFLAREEWYQAVRAAQIGDRVIPLVGDFAGPKALPALADWLAGDAWGSPSSTSPTSSSSCSDPADSRAYVANLRKLPWLEGAVLIRTSTREIPHPERSPETAQPPSSGPSRSSSKRPRPAGSGQSMICFHENMVSSLPTPPLSSLLPFPSPPL